MIKESYRHLLRLEYASNGSYNFIVGYKYNFSLKILHNVKVAHENITFLEISALISILMNVIIPFNFFPPDLSPFFYGVSIPHFYASLSSSLLFFVVVTKLELHLICMANYT